jgi:hypothetical protein
MPEQTLFGLLTDIGCHLDIAADLIDGRQEEVPGWKAIYADKLREIAERVRELREVQHGN